ncbi:carboxypeptidase-like regulatory domain-containing protein [Tenacibaculum maritimum]|uniref:carboxypeptidase-like regulatory domain-containing protein n=2 Tax=Tenacibaculum maritimum TaxID=107401 RepID=UPI0038775328
MKKNVLLVTLLFILSVTFAQEGKHLIKGKILLQNIPVSDVHITNKNTKAGTISNNYGIFEIYASKGDSISFSHVNLRNKTLVIDTKKLDIPSLIVPLTEKSIILNEVVVGENKSIFYIDKSIANHSTDINATTLKLPYTKKTKKNKEAPIKINTGISFSLDHILSQVSGLSKRREAANKMAKEDELLNAIRKYFTDDFFITDLSIKKAYINRFLNYCIDKNIIYYYRKENQLKLVEVLLSESKKFPYQIERDSTLLSKR